MRFDWYLLGFKTLIDQAKFGIFYGSKRKIIQKASSPGRYGSNPSGGGRGHRVRSCSIESMTHFKKTKKVNCAF